MKIHRRLIILVGIGMLLIIFITILSFRNITTAFSHTITGMVRTSSQSEQTWEIERKVNEMSLAVHNYVESGGANRYRKTYELTRSNVHETLDRIPKPGLDELEQSILDSIKTNLARIEQTSGKILSLHPAPDKAEISTRIGDLDALIRSISVKIESFQRENASDINRVMDELQMDKERIIFLLLTMLLTSVSFLLAFGLYIHRKVSVPLNDLWAGAEEISKGNLDYRMQLHGEGDIARLAARFNEMTQKLKLSYDDLEQKLYDRTRELAALDSVALTLSRAGTLEDVLNKSLNKILESLGGILPKGGVFLCDPDGETLRLVVHKGLSPDFVRREAVVGMGECLCGIVAQNGELLFTETSCDDKRHTRPAEEEAHSHIIIPMKSRGIVLGVIFLYPQVNFKLKPSDIQMLDAIGVQLGMAVENFRFYAEVKESSEKYWDLFENSRDILFTVDLQGALTSANKEAEKFSGYSKVELSSKTIFDFLTPEGAERAKKMLAGEEPSGGSQRSSEFEVIRRDGGRIFADVSGRKIVKDGKPIGYQVSVRDITEQKSLRVMLVKAERLGAMGQLGVAVRHEINNPLTTVIGNLELLIERYEDKDKELTARLGIVLNNAVRIAEIVKRLQSIKQEKVVDYVTGVKMTDLK